MSCSVFTELGAAVDADIFNHILLQFVAIFRFYLQ